MSSYDKVVKLACKPKAAPPKAKYLDPILAATWTDDGAVHDVCKALSPRFREPNVIVVFKALIVLHSMIRNGSTDNVLGYLSKGEVLKLNNVSAGNWEGYEAPQNVQNYAVYLDSRIRAYHDLKHDAIRVQSESNRDLRNSRGIEEDRNRSSTRSKERSQSLGPRATDGPMRSKTVMGRKLRVMSVEKGLLRETHAVQRMIATLVECKFYEDNLEDELATTALSMLVKDLLILFQASNEGVVNVLEHYFEMSHVDAKQALAIYRSFCKQTELVVEYLSIAKKLQNLIHVPIPTLKHAPVSLAGALQEYLSDPDFEKNRQEYRANKRVADGLPSASNTEAVPSLPPKHVSSSSTSTITSPSSQKPGGSMAPGKQAMQDFFAAIEEEAPTMFTDPANSPSSPYFQQQAAPNPFGNFGVAPQTTGYPTINQPFQVPQQTGFPHQQPFPFQAPQQTGFPQQQQSFQVPAQNPFPGPFGMQPIQEQPTQHRPFSTFLQSQSTGFIQAPMLQPQTTGTPNPFRQSMLLPQTTGLAAFQGQQMPNFSTGQSSTSPFPPTGLAAMTASTSSQYPWMSGSMASSAVSVPQRPASTPLTSIRSETKSSLDLQPVKTHQTGSRNPFGVPVAPAPPVPKPPTMMELAMASYQQKQQPEQQQQQQQPEQQTSGTFSAFNDQQAKQPDASGTFNRSNAFETLNGGQTATDMASIASSFSGASFFNSQPTSTSGSNNGSSLSTQPTGATAVSSAAPSTFGSSLQPQTTGFPALKPFKPSSNFGTSLFESLPPIPQSQPATPAGSPPTNGLPSNGTFGTFSSQFTAPPQPINSQMTGMGEFGLKPQMTGGPNPFRASTLGPLGGFSGFNGGQMFASMNSPASNAFPSGQNPAGQQQQPQRTGSLI